MSNFFHEPDSFLAYGVIETVSEDNSFFSARIEMAAKGRTGFPRIVRFTYPGYNFVDSSGIFHIPRPGECVIFACIRNNYFPLAFTSPLCVERKRINSEKAVNGEFTKFDTFEKKDLGYASIPNFSAGRKKMDQGTNALLGPKAKNGIIVFPGGKVEVFASELCSRWYMGDNANPDVIPKITDRTIEYELEASGYQFISQRINRKTPGQTSGVTATEKTETKQKFFQEAGKLS
ncbi:MAG: hypothetical protein WC341_17980, partial [Bacteroidales bacterium]